ncbi:MAG TPA: tetratricopeptide repeat protein [Thermoanaerobaculia bacterium]|nr:tetratricopeptide repeat protein [Thermoanaerobaculia bacterium]
MGKAARSKSARRDRAALPAPPPAARSRVRRRLGPPAFRAEYLAAILLTAAGLVVYSNALRGPFVLDDHAAITSNTSIRSLSPDVLSPPARTAVSGRPVVNLTLAFNHAVGGLNPASYHAFNVALHLLAALTFFGITRRTLGSPELQSRFRDRALPLAAAVALLWVVHPLATETVNYTIQRTELLMGLFTLLTLYCAIRAFESPGRRLWEAAALLAFALAMGSKEVAVVAPMLVLAHDSLFWSKSLREALRRHLRLHAGLALVLLVCVLLVATRFRRTLAGFVRDDVTPWEYALTQSGVIVHYLRLAFWPNALAADYGGWPVARSIRDVLPFLFVVVALFALTVWGVLRRKKLAFLGVVFFLVLAPTSSFRALVNEVAAERRMYLPLAAVVALVVMAGDALRRRLGAASGVGAAVVATLALALALTTVRRNDDYRTTLAFWTDVVDKRPDNGRAREWLGDYLYKRGRYAEAFPHLEAAARLQPASGRAQYSFGVALANRGRKDEAIERYRAALRLEPDYPPARNNLGIELADRGRFDEAIRHYRAALRVDPGYALAHYNLARALARLGRSEETTTHLEEAVRLQPDFADARRALDARRNRANR